MTLQRRSRPRRASWALTGALGFLAALAIPGTAAANDAQKLIDDSAAMVRTMLSEQEWTDFYTAFKNAKAVILIPDFSKPDFSSAAPAANA